MQTAPRDLTTTRLTLRPPAGGDRALWVALHRDPALSRQVGVPVPASDEVAAQGLTDCLGRWDSAGFDYGVVEETSTRSGIGVGGLRRLVPQAGEEEVLNLYYRFAGAVHGRGLATEAARAWTAHAVEWLPELPVVARSLVSNQPSRRTAERAGLEPEPGWGRALDEVDGIRWTHLRAPRVEERDRFDEATRESLLDLWCAVNDAGGAVGFLPGAERGRVAEALSRHEGGMTDGRTTAVLLRGRTGRVVGAGFWVAEQNPMLGHTRTAYRVMTAPDLRGRNLGRLLLAAMHRVARQRGVEVALLDVRSGLGTTRFYEACGYVEVGRLPGVIRVAAGDDRDRVVMARRLDGRAMVADGRA